MHLSSISVYETPVHFYVIGADASETRFCTLKIDRLREEELAIGEPDHEYSKADIGELLATISSSSSECRPPCAPAFSRDALGEMEHPTEPEPGADPHAGQGARHHRRRALPGGLLPAGGDQGGRGHHDRPPHHLQGGGRVDDLPAGLGRTAHRRRAALRQTLPGERRASGLMFRPWTSPPTSTSPTPTT